MLSPAPPRLQSRRRGVSSRVRFAPPRIAERKNRGFRKPCPTQTHKPPLAVADAEEVDREGAMRLRHYVGLLAVAAAMAPVAAVAADTIKIGFPIPMSGFAAVYGEPILKGAEMAVAEINAKGGVLGRKLELLERDSKANADDAVRISRELIIKNNVDFLVGTQNSDEAAAVSTVAKENKIVLIAPASETMMLTDAEHIHPYIFRIATNTFFVNVTATTE